MVQVTIMEFLQQQLPTFQPYPPPVESLNTKSKRFNFLDIHSLGTWNAFILGAILQQYRHVLDNTLIEHDREPASPPRLMTNEGVIRAEVCEILRPRIRRSLRVAFAFMISSNTMQARSMLSYDVGEAAQVIDLCKPDLATFDITALPTNALNRVPGDVKPSWKWRTEMRDSPHWKEWKEFRQALSQVNYYMNQHRTKYGYIVTDQELVAIRTLDRNGNLQLSQPIPWSAAGTSTQTQLTALLSLWYLGMLASENHGVNQWEL